MSIPEDKAIHFSPENVEREVGSYIVSKEKLGEGGTAVVKLAWNRQRKDLAAVKQIAKYRLTDRGRDNLERECVLLPLFSLFKSGFPAL
jgi:predicted Ser/Thr protein kinase